MDDAAIAEDLDKLSKAIELMESSGAVTAGSIGTLRQAARILAPLGSRTTLSTAQRRELRSAVQDILEKAQAPIDRLNTEKLGGSVTRLNAIMAALIRRYSADHWDLQQNR